MNQRGLRKVIGVRKGHLLKTSGKNVIPEKKDRIACEIASCSLHIFIRERSMYVMAIGVVEFSREGYKIRKVFA